MIRVHLFFYK